tara:strand:+ start:538 stop:702 length:165 start_codon:yes stop_codon:yes gene_type:complete
LGWDEGAVEAFEAVRELRTEVSLNLLWVLEGAIRDVDCWELSADVKAELKSYLE